MKGVLQFKLPEEKDEFKIAQNGAKYLCVLQELDENLRKKIKYDDTLHPEKYDAYEEIRSLLHELCSQDGISLHD